MNRIFNFTILFFLVFIQPLQAQKKDGTEYILNASEFLPPLLSNIYYASDKLPFKDIIVKDYRFDTSKIGYIPGGNGELSYNKIQLMYDWSALLTNYFRQNLDPASGHTLYIVIKSYWMQEGILDEITTKKVIQRSTWDRREPGGTCKAALDIYIQADAYLHPFFKIDDVFLNFNKFSPRRVNEWIFLPFDSMARKIMASDIATVLTKKKNITIAQTDSFYTKRFDLPILKTTALLKGIYLTFQDFINNKIMAADFRWQNGTITDELYLVQNGTESLVTEFWGFSDGKTLFIKSGFNIYPAIRRQNTFEVFGAKHITNYHNNASPNDLIKINSMSVDRKILQLSMETGKFY